MMYEMPIPEERRTEWEAISQELREATVEMVSANQRYLDAIAARIALHAELREGYSSQH